jgi:alpha-galactosidase
MLWAAAILVGLEGRNASGAVTVTADELAQKTAWVQQNLLTATNIPPFSFSYNGLASTRLLPSWNRSEKDTILDANRTQHEIIWSNNVLQVRCEGVEYSDYPVVEWTVYLKNISPTSPTPLLQGIEGLNTTFSRTNGPEFVLNGNQGDSDTPQSFQPFHLTLSPSSANNFSPPSYSGRSCDSSGWPYYNLQTQGGGMILAIGWPGQWASSFTRDGGTNLQVVAGQQTTHLILNPGEEIRTPLIALLFWHGTDVVRSQNIWRRWYIAHVIPRVNGQPPSPVLQVQGDNVAEVNADLQIGIHPDILWRDAGSGPGTTWYPSANGPYTGGNTWLNTGTWDVDTNAYPNGFLPTSRAVNALGTKFLLWFEPERIGNTNNSFLATNNPSWLLPATSLTVGAILNEGNPQVFNWLTNHIENLIISNGIDWYREDMNGNGPLTAWQNNDAANRQGITENFYVQNHLAYWDALLAMNPGLRID